MEHGNHFKHINLCHRSSQADVKFTYFSDFNFRTMKTIKHIFLTLLCMVGSVASAQNDFGISIGNWRTHLPYQKVIDVDIMHSKVFAATPFEVFYYDTEDYSLNILNKVNGLSDVGIKALRYNQPQNLIVVAYTNANIDLIYDDGSICNINDIKIANIMGNKTVNDICFNGSLAYLSCGFGIVVIDLARREVKDTYLIGNQGHHVWVNDIAFFDGKIFAASEHGLYWADLSAANLADYSNWHTDTLAASTGISEVETWGNHLFLNKTRSDDTERDSLFTFDGSAWTYFSAVTDDNFSCIRTCGSSLCVCGMYGIYFIDEDLTVAETESWPAGATYPQSVAIGNDGFVWIGDSQRGLIKSEQRGWGESFCPYGPYSNNVYDITASGDEVWVSAGGRDANWAKVWNGDGAFHYNGQKWESLTSSGTSSFTAYPDIVCAAIDPKNHSHAFLGSWGYGVYEVEEDRVVNHFDETNSTLGRQVGTEEVKISGLAFDSKGALWAANSGTSCILSKYADGQWHGYNLGASSSAIDISKMMIDNNDSKWIIKRIDGMILVFNENSSQTAVTLTSEAGHGGLPGTVVYSMLTDLNGSVWIGTDDGIGVIYNPKNIFNGKNYDASLIMVPRNDGSGQADALFSGQKVMAMAVDGANHKWIATEGGVYEMSADGLVQLNHFSTGNSPLLTNKVSTMAIDAGGEIFFGTNSGIISYRGKAAAGNKDNSNVLVYPNPFRPDYDGFVAIKGLVSNAEVKITTSSGDLVARLDSEGGQAVWNRKTLDGQDVTSGVYLVFVSDRYGIETCVARIVLIQ